LLKQAVFLVGGLGSRLKQLTANTPKPLIPVAGRPFLDYLIDEAARHGFTDIVLLAGYLGEHFDRDYDGRLVHGARVRVLREEEPLGTGGAIRQALPHLDEFFLLANGDSFFDINLRALPIPAAGEITMALRATAPGARYGTVTLDGQRVRSFHAPAEGRNGPINAGIYLVSRAVIEAIPAGKSSLEADHFPALARDGRIVGVAFDRWFIDMGVPEDLARADVEMGARTRRPAVFFDRDGVLNTDLNYVHRPDQVEWMPQAIEALRLCNDQGWFVFVVTNQAGVAHGYYQESDIHALHEWMSREFMARGAHVDEFEYCPHHPEGRVEKYRRTCDRRKPGGGMLRDLLGRWSVDAERSFLVGNMPHDIEAARAAGIEGRLYTGGSLRDFVAARLD
jgi:D-glycero-D-manno-heptose 1,7-bisphosphate phosphatase